jgi:hypothetical protein
MKNMVKLSGIIRMALVIGLILANSANLFGAPTVWDKSVPKGEAAVLHFGDSASLQAIDGETKSLGPVVRDFPGKGGSNHPPQAGSDFKPGKSQLEAKAIMTIPPGSHELTFIINNGIGKTNLTVTYDFVAGRHYFFAMDFDKSLEKFDNSIAAVLKAKPGDYVWDIRDVTGEKWAK